MNYLQSYICIFSAFVLSVEHYWKNVLRQRILKRTIIKKH